MSRVFAGKVRKIARVEERLSGQSNIKQLFPAPIEALVDLH
jgi:hypothetical protein